MNANRVLASTAFLFTIFILQEAVINQINFPISGFSLYLAITVAWIALDNRSGALLLGFIAGIWADLSPSASSPFGQWTLVLTLSAYLISHNSDGFRDLEIRPLTLLGITCVGVCIALILFILISAILGEDVGSITHIAREIIGNAIWSALLSPIYLPLVTRIHRASLTSRDRV